MHSVPTGAHAPVVAALGFLLLLGASACAGGGGSGDSTSNAGCDPSCASGSGSGGNASSGSGGSSAGGAGASGTAGPVTLALPLEILGSDGTEVCAEFSVNGAGPYELRVLFHHLTYADKASLRINGGAETQVDGETAPLDALASQAGGFGGGIDLFQLAWSAPDIVMGTNEICFVYHRQPGDVSIGYRVVDVEVTDATGDVVSAGIGHEDPSTWTAPDDSPDAIAAGESYFREAELNDPIQEKTLAATCSDCHAQDGRDLKYFNFSNRSIIERAKFHGLSEEQGQDIASYIRTLNAPQSEAGRPYAPAYQPAPGLDAKPVAEWAAGGGVDAILGSWGAMTDELFPDGIQASAMVMTPGNPNLNMRERRLAVPLLDWFHWLPQTHPKDTIFADEFLASGFYGDYLSLRSTLTVGDATGMSNKLTGWRGNKMDFVQNTIGQGAPIWGSTPSAWRSRLRYDAAIWATVKQWELMQEFQLEEQGTEFFGSAVTVEQRTWVEDYAFRNATNFTLLENADHSLILNGTIGSLRYVNFAWYYLQLVLNTGHGLEHGNRPIDWKYFHGRMKYLNAELGMHGTGIVHFAIIAKALQIFQIGTPDGSPKWEFDDMQIWRLGMPDSYWEGTDQVALIEALLPAYVAQVESFTPQQFYNSGDSDFDPNNTDTSSNNGRDALARTWEAMGRFAELGVDPSLRADYATWAQSIWPKLDWHGQAGL